jgi:hypothetical protein
MGDRKRRKEGRGKRKEKKKRCQALLTSVILATQEAEIRRIAVQSQPGQKKFARPCLEKPFTKIGLVEWLKVKALSSSPSTAKKKKEKGKL